MLANHPLFRGACFDSVYVGGGTPTCIAADLLLGMLSHLKKTFRIDPDSEITIEANPGSLDLEGLERLVSAGVNRLSLGVQSFSERLLKAIGRSHCLEDIYLGIEKAGKAGIANLSLDLIFGLPGQTPEDFQSSLEAALALSPLHLSLYELMVEERTPLADDVAEGKLILPAEDRVAEMAETARTICRRRGFKHYEIANFAREGFYCRHNLHYWQNHDYLGVGAGAVTGWRGLRIRSEHDPGVFIKRVGAGRLPISGLEGLCREASFRETVIMGLRMTDGISLISLQERFGMSPASYYGTVLNRLMDQDLIEIREDRLRLTARGRPVANQVLQHLV